MMSSMVLPTYGSEPLTRRRGRGGRGGLAPPTKPIECLASIAGHYSLLGRRTHCRAYASFDVRESARSRRKPHVRLKRCEPWLGGKSGEHRTNAKPGQIGCPSGVGFFQVRKGIVMFPETHMHLCNLNG